MITMEEEIINVFFEVDEALKGMAHKSHHHAAFTDSEVITVGIMKELWHMKTEQAIWRLIRDQFRHFFPQLCSYSRFLKRCKWLGALMKKLGEQFAQFDPTTLKIVDSMPIPLLVGVRCYRSMVTKICQRYRIRPAWGYCAAKKMYYYGFKLIAITEGTKILNYTLVPANTSEQAAFMTLISREDLQNISVFGDKGFLMNSDDKKILAERQINLEAIPKKNMNQNLIENLKPKKKWRKMVETNFSQLSVLFDLTHFILRSITGFAVNIIRKVLAYNISRVLPHNQKELLAI